jgi:predicted RNase H-like HicB family nuclease
MAKHRKREFSVIVERDADGWYVAEVPELPGCHTQARSLDKLMERAREAIELCLAERGESGPTVEFVGVRRVTV